MAAARIATLGKRRPAENAAAAVFSQSAAADKFHVSADSIQRARKVIDGGSKALQRAVEHDEVSLKGANQHTAAAVCSQSDAVEKMDVSRSSVQRARKVIEG
ncbi:MAG: hypothetical protein IPI06_14595 [Gammaproteobacteria bacterium]|nr:hypothetical protein [Gammaproteobacteria bacterium]